MRTEEATTAGEMDAEGTIADVHCPNCGAPAKYDIVSQHYHCSYCASKVEVSEAQAQKRGFRSLQQEKIKQSAGQYHLMQASCSGCGAELVFEESEALADCAFCGRALVRKDYLADQEMPELVIPFRITQAEAAERLQEWCRKNKRRPEAKHLRDQAEHLQGCYLPYELVRGPVSCKVGRMDAGRTYHCGGYAEDVFINCSQQLDNQLLDGMEPYELEDLREFDFAFAAGQRVKVRDVDEEELKKRIDQEVSNDYAPTVRKTMRTKAVEVETDPDSVLRMPVLLPVYYIAAGDTLAAVNGQTGKVSVRAEKASHYYFIPWWLKAIIATVLICGAAFGAFRLFGMALGDSLYITGILALFTIVVTLVAYSDTIRNKFRVESAHKVFTSRGGPWRRTEAGLAQEEKGECGRRGSKALEKQVVPPVFFEELEGTTQPVKLVFSSFRRKALTVLLALVALFLPVIIALFLNGFDFQRLTLGGSAVWFCIMVPVVPIYLLKFASIELYEHPWIYTIGQDGKKRRYRKKRESRVSKEDVLTALGAAFVPPGCLAVWFGIICFCVMCYLTAFGFD